MVLQWVALCFLIGHVSGQGYSNRHCADFKTAVEGQPHKYIEMVNMAPMVRDCPPMTHFNQGTCDCSVLIIDTGHGTNIHGGVETSMHHSDPVDMGHDPMAADLANLPTSVLLEMLHQEQQISPPQFNVPTVPPPIPTQPVQSSWQEFTLPESGAKASLDQNQLVIRVPVDRPFDGTQFNQNVDQFSYVPTVEPIDPIVNMFGNGHAHQDFMIPTTTPVPRIEMYKPYVPETLANIPEVVAIITQIQQKVRSKTMAEQKRAFETFFKHFSANLAKYQSQKETVTDPPRPRRRQGIPIRESRIQVRTTPLPPQPRIVTFPPDATESPFPTESAVEVPLPPPPRSNIKDRTRFTERISPNIEKTPPKIDISNQNEQPSLPVSRMKSEVVSDTRRMSSSESKPSDRIKSEFTKTGEKLTDVSETTKATKSNVQVLPKTLPPVKTTPKPEERPKTMKEILGILRRRLRKKGVPKEKITVSLLKSMISKDKKLIAMIRRSKKFIKKAKQNQESKPEQKSSTVQIQAKKDISRVKNTSDKKPTVLKTVRAVENKDKQKDIKSKDEHFKKQSDMKANRENAIQSKDAKAAKNLNKAARVISQNADGMKKAKTPMPSTKGTTRTVPRLPKIETSARMNHEKAINVPIPPPPPPQVLAPGDRRSVKQRSFNIQITDKANDISPNIVKTTRDSHVQTDVSVDSQSHASAPVEESRNFFGMPPPPPPPPFVSSANPSSTITHASTQSVNSREAYKPLVNIKINAKENIMSEVKETLKSKMIPFKQDKVVTTTIPTQTTVSERIDTSTFETTISSPQHENKTGLDMVNIQPNSNQSLENTTSSKSNASSPVTKPKIPFLDPKILPPFPFLLLLKPSLLKHVIGQMSTSKKTKVQENIRLKVVKGITKPVVLNNETGLVYSSNESISGIREIHTKKGNPAIRGIQQELKKHETGSHKSWRRGHSRPMENFQTKLDPPSRSLSHKDNTGGIPIPSNLVSDMSKILNRIEKKSQKAKDHRAKDLRRDMRPLPSRNEITQRMKKAKLLAAAKSAAVKTGLGISSETPTSRMDLPQPAINASPVDTMPDRKSTLGVNPAEEAVKKLDQQIANLLKTMNEGRNAATPRDMKIAKQPDLTHLGIGRPQKTPPLIENRPTMPSAVQSNIPTDSSVLAQTSTAASPSLDISKLASSLTGTSMGGASAQTGQSSTVDAAQPQASLPSNIDVNGLLNMVKFALNQPANSVSQSPLMNQIKQLVSGQTAGTGQSTESPLMTQIKQAISMLASGSGSGQGQSQQINANDILNQFIAKISPNSDMSSMNGGSANPLGNMLTSLTGGGGMPQMNSGFPQMGSPNPFGNMGSSMMSSFLSSGDMPFNLGGGSQMGMLQRVMQQEGGGDAAEMASSMFGGGGGGGMSGMEGFQMGGMPGGLMFGS